MPVTLTLQQIPSGSQLTSTIGADESDDKNDFSVLILLDANGTGLTESDITFSTGASLVSLTGANSVWQATIRPPETAGTVTITVAADAFTEGNAETSQDIRVSTNFPDTDAETSATLFSYNAIAGAGAVSGIAVTSTRIVLVRPNHSGFYQNDYIHFYTLSGVEQAAEEIERRINFSEYKRLDAINGDFFVGGRNHYDKDFNFIESLPVLTSNAVTHTRLGITEPTSGNQIRVLPYGETTVELFDIDASFTSRRAIAHHSDFLYLRSNVNSCLLLEIDTDDTINLLGELNIDLTSILDLFIYRDTLYLLNSTSVNTLDIRPYRPLAKNTKTTIYPVFANEGDTIPLKQYCPDAKTITFGVGFDKPSYLSINADNELEIASNAVTETQPVLVRLTGINYIDSVDFQFYLIIVQAANPIVRDVDELTMRANSSFDLFQIVSGAESLTFRSGRTQPTGSSISNGVFTIGTASGTAYFTATNTNGSTHFQIKIVAIGTETLSDFSDTFRHRVLIAGIDVTNDVTVFPEVSVNSDVDTLNEYLVNEVTIVLRSDQRNGYRFNKGVSSNFWAANNLNIGGFRETVEVYIESLVGGSYVSHLQFAGVIDTDSENFTAATVSLVVLDVSSVLEAEPIEDFGTLEKWDALRPETDESSFSGTYIPERSLLPLQLRTGAAWSDRTALILRDLALPSEGPPIANAAYMTKQDFQTSGGFLENAPLLRFKGEHRSEDIRFLFKQLALNSESLYNTEIELPEIETETPYILNRGSVPFSVENTRITRLLTDWVYDSTNARVLMLLSNPEGHIADVLVQYDVDGDAYRILHTFDNDIKTHRITRRNATNYYILTSGPITQDRSAATLPRTADKTAYAFDSVAVGSAVKIYAYNTNTGVLTAHVEETNTRPPQLGIHFHVGFENALYIDEFEGIVADYRGSFKWYSGNLYYRYATDGEFGVARVNTSGTTTEMIDQTTLNYHNHLNFAFDVTSGGDIYFVYSVGDGDESSLVIKRRTSAGVETTILTDTQDLADLTALSDDGGAYLGAHECLFHNNQLYFFAPIQRVDEDSGTYTRSREKSAGMVLLSCDVTAGTPSLTVIETWDFVSHSACNLTIHDGAVHYTEQPIAASRFKPINSSL